MAYSVLAPTVQLQNRVIKTTVTFEEEDVALLGRVSPTKTFLSKGGRLSNSNVYMRQDFFVKQFVNISGGGMATAEIRFWNLSDESATQIEAKGLTVQLEAGWEGKTGEIFSGRVSSVTRTKPDASAADVVTTLYCVGGLNAMQGVFYQQPIDFEDVLSVLGRVAAAMGMSLQADSQIQGALENVTLQGDTMTILQKLSTQFNFNFYWTQTRLVVKALLPIGQVKVAQTYDPTNGLLDIPVVTERGVEIKVFLDPQIRSGDGFELTSKFANFNIGSLNFINRVRGQNLNTSSAKVNSNRYQGTYQALGITHTGSSHENTWETLISGMGAVNFQNINRSLRLDIQ